MSIIQPTSRPAITGAYLDGILGGDWANQRPVLGGQSLEDNVANGDAWERQKAFQDGTSLEAPSRISRCPNYVIWDLNMLRHKDREISSLSRVCRYVTRTGLPKIEQIPAVTELRRAKRAAYAIRRESILEMFTAPEFTFPEGGRPSEKPFQSRIFMWVSGALSDLALDLNLAKSNVTLLALCMGLLQSETWLPTEAIEMCLKGLRTWIIELEERVDGLGRLLS